MSKTSQFTNCSILKRSVLEFYSEKLSIGNLKNFEENLYLRKNFNIILILMN